MDSGAAQKDACPDKGDFVVGSSYNSLFIAFFKWETLQTLAPKSPWLSSLELSTAYGKTQSQAQPQFPYLQLDTWITLHSVQKAYEPAGACLLFGRPPAQLRQLTLCGAFSALVHPPSQPAAEMAAMGSEPIVVADVGSCFARVGLAGASTPAAVCHSIVGKPKYRRVLKGATSAPADGQLVCGDAAMSQRALLALRRPATADGVADVSDWLALWDHVLASTDSAAKGGGGSLSSAAVALVAPRCASTAVQAGLVQALLASRKHSRVRLVNPAAAALYSAGLTTGVALDVGHTGSAAVPILDGFAVPTAARRSRAGGASVVHTVRESLRQQGLHLDLPSEVEVAREIAEAVSQCGADPKQAVPGKYQLPDGSMLAVPSEAIRAGDCLFSPGNPDEPGLHTIVAACVAATDLHARASLLNNVVMYGGGSLYTGAPQAFLNNLAASVPRGVNVSVRASKDRFMAPWTGASVLTALEYKAEEGSWLTAGDIEEHGAVRAVERMHW